MLLIQLLLIIFFLFAIIKVVARFRSGDITWGWTLFWALFWLLAGTVVLLPNITMPLARLFGVARGSDLIVYLAVALLFYLYFRMMVKIDRLDRNITKIARLVALDTKEKK